MNFNFVHTLGFYSMQMVITFSCWSANLEF